MRFNTKKTVCFSFLFFLVACSNAPQLPKTKIADTRKITTKSGSELSLSTVYAINGEALKDTNDNLNVVARTDTAKVVGLKVLQFGAQLFTGGQVQSFSKEQLKGSYIDSVKNNTIEYLNPKLDSFLTTLNISSNNPNDISIKPYKFKLIYDGLTDDKYNFIYTTTISAGNYSYICSSDKLPSSETMKPIDEWEKDNYKLTQVVAEKIIDVCIEQINTSTEREKFENGINNFN